MDIRDFFIKDFEKTSEFLVSERFKDKEGNQIYFEIKPITYLENQEILKSSKDKNGNLNDALYRLRLVCKSVVSPNLRDSSLQEFYSALGEEKLLSKMLLAFEFENLASEVYKISGFNFSLNESVDHLKN